MSNRKIAWEKFIPKEEDFPKMDIISNNEEESSFVDHPEDISKNDILLPMESMFLPPAKTQTPFGLYGDEDPFSPYNMFDCWIGHTNFRITNEDFDLLDKKVDGIGCLKVLSTYRFFIGLEKLFSFTTVRMQIQKELCNNLLKSEIITDDFDSIFQQALDKMNETLMSIKTSDKWAVFIGKDGEIKAINSGEFGSDHEYRIALKDLKSMKNGNIITCATL